MTQDEIIDMARQADGQVTMWVNHSTIQKTTTFTFESPIDYRVSGDYPELYHIKFLERFANLVAAKALAQTQEPVACGTYQEVTDLMNALWAGTLEQVQIAEEMKNKKLYTKREQT